MTRVAWLVGLGGSLAYFLLAAFYAYSVDAFGVSGLVVAVLWCVPLLARAAKAVGLLKNAETWLIRIVNALWGRLVIIGVALVGGTLLIVAARGVHAPPTWTCTSAKPVVHPPDRARCGEGTFAQMRTFRLQLLRAKDPASAPTVHARATNRTAASVGLDSDRGGLCSATGPDLPTYGESQLVLVAACGADRTYPVNLNICDATATTGALAAAAELEIREGDNAQRIACD